MPRIPLLTVSAGFLCLVLFFVLARAEEPGDPETPLPQRLGGLCKYETIKGKCRVTSIVFKGSFPEQLEFSGYPGYEGLEVSFRFLPDVPLIQEVAGWSKRALFEILNRTQIMLLANSWYPGPRYLEKYKIAENATFACNLNLMTEGTCSPVVFRFDTIDTADYFESGK